MTPKHARVCRLGIFSIPGEPPCTNFVRAAIAVNFGRGLSCTLAFPRLHHQNTPQRTRRQRFKSAGRCYHHSAPACPGPSLTGQAGRAGCTACRLCTLPSSPFRPTTDARGAVRCQKRQNPGVLRWGMALGMGRNSHGQEDVFVPTHAPPKDSRGSRSCLCQAAKPDNMILHHLQRPVKRSTSSDARSDNVTLALGTLLLQ